MDNKIHCRRLGTMVDCSRNAVMRPDMVKDWIDVTADMGYNCLMLYTEDTYEIKERPYFGHLRGRYTEEELRQIDDHAAKRGMELIPCIQTLAHLRTIFHWPAFAGVRDFDSIMMVGEEKTYQLIEDMFAMIKRTFRSRVVNVGMDEAHMLGRGRYLTKNGLRDKADILMEHLERVSQIAKKYDLELLMWGDMFFRIASGGEYYAENVQISDRVKGMVPDNVNLVYWDYYSVDPDHYDQQIKAHADIKEGIWFAGGVWTWAGFAPHNVFSIESMDPAIKCCQKYGLNDIIMTMWGDNGGECSRYALLPSLYYVAQLAKGNDDIVSIKQGFEAMFGIPFDAFMLLDLPGTPNEKPKAIANPEKYMLYCDCFQGQFDNRVAPGQAESYIACAQKLAQWEEHPRFGHLFASMKALCDVLAIKYDLGVRTRKAYLEKDQAALQALLADYELLAKRIDRFYQVYRKQWMLENKTFGFELQDHRLGGLARRVTNCKEMLEDFLAGKVSSLEELEAPVLDIFGEEDAQGKTIEYNSWATTITANVI